MPWEPADFHASEYLSGLDPVHRRVVSWWFDRTYVAAKMVRVRKPAIEHAVARVDHYARWMAAEEILAIHGSTLEDHGPIDTK